jgi:hypothetical protein
MKLSDLKGKTVLVKLAEQDTKNPIPLKLVGEDATGIWFQNKNIAGQLMGRLIPPEFSANPYVFIPLTRIEWLMLADTDAP